MSAAYPKAVKAFTVKHDLSEDVYAVDINDLQDEVKALEMMIGVNPLVMPDKDPNQVVSWTTLAGRMDALDKGLTKPIFATTGGEPSLSANPALNDALTFTFPVPSPEDDPYRLFNGTDGFKVRKTGWYHITASMKWGSVGNLGDPPTGANGTHRLTIWGDNKALVMEDTEGNVGSEGIYVTTTYTGILPAGTVVRLGVWVYRVDTYRAQEAHLSGVFIRSI